MFSSKFVKSFRIALMASEWQMSQHLDISIEEYICFERCPLTSPGRLHAKFQPLLCQVLGTDGYTQFSRCLEADSLLNRKVVSIDKISMIQLVKASKAE